MTLVSGSLLTVALSAGTPAGAAVNGHCGDVVVGALRSGVSLREGQTSSTDLQVLPERQNVALTSSMAVDLSRPGFYGTPGSLPSPRPILLSGRRLNSYLIQR
jgi:hypothetical protein